PLGFQRPAHGPIPAALAADLRRDRRPTFLDPRGPPSRGGDRLARSAKRALAAALRAAVDRALSRRARPDRASGSGGTELRTAAGRSGAGVAAPSESSAVPRRPVGGGAGGDRRDEPGRGQGSRGSESRTRQGRPLHEK